MLGKILPEVLSVVVDPPNVNEDTVFDRITSFNAHTWAWLICAILALVVMRIWKSPLGKGLMIGAVIVFIFFMMKK